MALISAGPWTALGVCEGTIIPTAQRTRVGFEQYIPVRKGDLLNHGGSVTEPAIPTTVIIEGEPVAVLGDPISIHTVGDTTHIVTANTFATNVNVGPSLP
jgi:uncharacterized Zn-binding protein involved in type VI secretion